MDNNNRIKGLTLLYEDNEKLLHNGLMLRYANGDFSFNIEDKINYELDILKASKGGTVNYENSYADFTYWKYFFLSCKDNEKYYDMKKALEYLKEAYKKGSPDAIAQYGYYYYVGEVVTKVRDKEKAMRFFQKALEVEKHRTKINQKTPFVEYLYADALERDAGEDQKLLREVKKYYEIALKEKHVVLCKKKLAKTYICLKENIEEAVKMLQDTCTLKELCDFVKDVNLIKKIR